MPRSAVSQEDASKAIIAGSDKKPVNILVIAGNDQMGIAAMKLMAGRNLTVPRDIAITGFNAFEFWQYTSPVLTTVRSPAYEMGARGGIEILRRLGEGRFERPEIIYPVELQPGGST